jgi:Tol biopolymer transport system component
MIATPDGSESRTLDVVTEAMAKVLGDPRWSPDGELIAYLKCDAQCSIRVINADGSGNRTILRNSRLDTWAWSPNSKKIAYGMRTGLYVIDVATGDKQKLSSKTIHQLDWQAR